MSSDKATTERSLVKNSFFLFARVSFNLVISLYSSRLILNALGFTDYGIYNVIGGIVTLGVFITNSMTMCTQRFLAFELGKTKNRISEIFSVSINIYIIMLIAILITSEFFGVYIINNYLNIPTDKLDIAISLFHLSILGFAINIMASPFNALIIAFERLDVYTYFGIALSMIKLLLVFYLDPENTNNLIIFGILMLIHSLFCLCIPILYVKISNFKVNYKLNLDRKVYRELLSYTSWSLLGNVASVSTQQGVNILLNIFFGPLVNASKSLSNQIGAAVQNFGLNISGAINPRIVKQYSRGDINEMLDLVYRGSKYSFLFVIFLTSPLFFYTKDILTIWLGEYPKYTELFVKLNIVNVLINSYSSPIMNSIQATGRIKFYQIAVSTVLFLNLPFSYLLLKYINKPEIIFYMMITISILAMHVRLVFFSRLFNEKVINFYKKVIVPTISTLIINYVLLKLIVVDYHFAINILICSISSMLIVLIFGTNKKEKLFLINGIKKWLKIKKLDC